MDEVAFAYRWRFRFAGDPVPAMASFFDYPIRPQLSKTDAFGSQNAQCGDDGASNSANVKMKDPSQEELLHDHVENENWDTMENRANYDGNEDSKYDEFFVPDLDQ